MKSVDERKQKIKNLKAQIQENQQNVISLITNLNVEKEMQLSEEESAKKKQEFRDTLAVKRAELKGLEETLNLTRLNKTGSSFFEWHPHKGMNRKQARRFYRLRRQGKLKPNKVQE